MLFLNYFLTISDRMIGQKSWLSLGRLIRPISKFIGSIFAKFSDLFERAADQSEIIFSIPQETLPWQPIFWFYPHN